MSKLVKPASLLFYLLTILVFFPIGIEFAEIIGAAEGQGLAGAAIFLGYGVMFSFTALLFSFLIAYNLPRERIIVFNKVLAILLLVFFALFSYRLLESNKSRSSDLMYSNYPTTFA